MMQETTTTPEKKESALLNIMLNVVIPAVIMTKFSTEKHLGETWGLVIALAFPLSYGLYDYWTRRKLNFFSAIGLASILLTGGIGLFKLNKTWMIVKETAIPLIMGLAVLLTQKTKYPLMRVFFNQIMDLDKIKEEFSLKSQSARFEHLMNRSCQGLGLSFLVSALLNYILAVAILEGEPGTTQFTESLGKMTALSFPVIAIPMTIMMGFIMVHLLKTIQKVTEQPFENFLRQK